MKTTHIQAVITLIIFALCIMVSPSFAVDDAYVTDSFKVTLRTGPSTENKIIVMLSSGQPVEILESENGWSHVRLKENNLHKEGWILSRYLMKRMPWKDEVKSLQESNTEMKEQLPRVKRELSEAQSREKVLASELEEKSALLDKLRNEYETLKSGASSYLELKKEEAVTREALDKTREELKGLTEENRVLISSKRNIWFMSGALVLLFGLIIGLAIGRKQAKNRSSLYS